MLTQDILLVLLQLHLPPLEVKATVFKSSTDSFLFGRWLAIKSDGELFQESFLGAWSWTFLFSQFFFVSCEKRKEC